LTSQARYFTVLPVAALELRALLQQERKDQTIPRFVASKRTKAGHEKSFLEWMAPAAGQLSASSEKGWDVASIATCHGPRQVSFHAGSLAKQQAGLARVALMSDDPRAVIVRSAETSTRRPTARSPSAPWMPLPWNEQCLPACRRPCVCVTRHAAGPESGATVRAEVVDNCPATGVSGSGKVARAQFS